MDYPITIDQVYKDQRPFRLSEDDLFMVSHGGKTKVCSVKEFADEVKREVLPKILESVSDGLINKIKDIDKKLSELSGDSKVILNELRAMIEHGEVSVSELTTEVFSLVESLIKVGGSK